MTATGGTGRLRVLMHPSAARLENPYLTLLCEALGDRVELLPSSSFRQLRESPDVLHVHWPEYLVRSGSNVFVVAYDVAKALLRIRLARHRNTALIWTAHNLQPHFDADKSLLRWYMSRFMRQVDFVISLSEGAVDQVRQRYPALARVPVAVIPHGHYRSTYAIEQDVAAARAAHGLDSRPVMLAFGQIRPDKGVPALARAWRALPEPRPQLLIAGQPRSDDVEHLLRDAVGDDASAHLLLDFVSDSEVACLFAAADVVLAPYHAPSTLNSGVVFLALSMGRPVVVADLPPARDLAEQVGPGWLYPCDGSPEDAIAVGISASKAQRADAPQLDDFDWEHIGALTADAYARAVSVRR